MGLHDKDEVLAMAKVMAKDFLNIHRACTYKDLSEIERENLEKVAQLARQVCADTGDYNPAEDDPSFGC